MVFKRPAGSRDDRPNKSSGRSKSGSENAKRPSSSSTGKPFGAGRTDGKKNFSVDKRDLPTPNQIQANQIAKVAKGQRKAMAVARHRLAVARKKHLYQKAGHTAAGQLMPTALKEASAMHHRANAKTLPQEINHTVAARNQQMAKAALTVNQV
jgi:hypothetical protein